MLKHYRNTHPYAIVLIIVTAIILWIPVFINPNVFQVSYNAFTFPLFTIFRFIFKLPDLPLVIIGFVVSILLAFFMAMINTKHQVIEKRNYLPALFFILSTAWIISVQQISPSLLGVIFVAFAFDRFFSSYNRTKVISSLFDAGILIGIGSLFYIPYSTLFIIIWLGIFLFRFEDWRAWLVSLFGFLTPWVITFGLYFYFTGNITELNQMILNAFSYSELTILPSPKRLVVLLGVLLLALYTGYFLLVNMKSMDIKSKRFFYLLNWSIIILFIVYLILPATEKFVIIGIAFPLSFLFANYFSLVKDKWYFEVIFSVYLAGMIISMYIPLFTK